MEFGEWRPSVEDTGLHMANGMGRRELMAGISRRDQVFNTGDTGSQGKAFTLLHHGRMNYFAL